MQMTKELEERLKLMQRFNQVHGDKRKNCRSFFYHNKIFVHNDIMYATDANIFVAAANLTDQKDFSFFKCGNKKFEYMDSGIQEVKEVSKLSKDGKLLEKILQPLTSSVSFDIDFDTLPTKLCSSWSLRHRDTMTVNFQTEEAIIDFCGGVEADGGITGTYGDIIKNISGTIPENPIHFSFWHIMEIMKQCKVKKIHIESNTDKHYNMCKVKDFKFIFM